ncbi:TraK family protein [Pseudomonas sp. CFBP 13602]|uniref:TraK family protein n=1 Tax=Pseudomonas sp. CFBP 13602 TaxID=2774039 RepID=UPI0017845502|nr:TraK family protein [Pseudomonas sp. CFBP 13602]MBD8829002.1 TraK family protein [Pseudomonas sp. CFBP 13602]
MAKNLSERIAERMKNKKTNVGAQNRGTFLALKGEITDALDNRWPVRTIWETLHEEGKVSFGYQAFRNYVNSLILAPKRSQKSSTAEGQVQQSADSSSKKKSAVAPAPRAKEPRQSSPQPPASTGFAFDPKPNKEDYL